MSNESRLNTPVLLIIFNRPETTIRVFERIRLAKPKRLYIAGDGPHTQTQDDLQRITKARAIASSVDWECEVNTLFHNENLGCKVAVSTAIDWVFEYEDQCIIVEDDCVPHPDFFNFCSTLLTYYEHDERVSVITGDNFQNGKKRGDASYYFSKYNHCWGWATWRRAWRFYNGEIPFWATWQHSREWQKLTPDRIERNYWSSIFDRVFQGEIDSWAYPWTASVWFRGGLTATPNVNLVSNIGFDKESTHTCDPNSPHANMATHPIGEIHHPKSIAQNIQADKFVFEHHFGGSQVKLQYRILRLLRKSLAPALQNLRKLL